ncbi:MAG: hypothetical protein KDA44_05205 [Planctomycetales bacterium]|nr:hypothetical protein [Planctomycetales bacterium]
MYGSTKILTVLVVVLAVAAVVFLFLPSDPPADETLADYPASLVEDRQAAQLAQQDGDWPRAHELWTSLADDLQAVEANPLFVAEAQRNARDYRERTLAIAGEVYDVAKADSPPEISASDLQRYYAPGRRVGSVAVGDVTGRGRNQDWGFVVDAYFAYECDAIIETLVLENDGRRLVAESHLKRLSQDLVVANERVRLAPIDSPIFALVWEVANSAALVHPKSHVAIRAWAALDAVDPGGERIFTNLYRRLKASGIDVAPKLETRIVQRIDELNGARIKLALDVDYGVRHVELLEGDRVPLDDLRAFARNSNLLLDFAVADLLTLKPDETGEIAAADLVRMIGLRYDVQVDGSLKFRRRGGQTTPYEFEPAGGEVRVAAEVDGELRRGVLRPLSGLVRYDVRQLLVVSADAEWTIDLSWASQDHLLFQTEGMRELTVRSHYEAQLVEASDGLAAP